MRGRSFLAILFGGILLLPMAWLLLQGGDQAFRDRIGEVLGTGSLAVLLSNSVILALLTAVVAVLLGLPLALLLNRREFPGRRLVGLLYVLPLMIPPQIHTIAWTRVIGDQGWLTAFMQGAFGTALDVRAPLASPESGSLLAHIYPGPAWIMATAYFPLVTLSVAAGVRALDPEALDAARLLGGRRRALWDVVLPQLGPRVIAGAAFVFLLALSTYPVVSLLDTPVLVQKVFFTFSQVDQAAGAALALPLVGVALLAVGVLGLAEARSPVHRAGDRQPERVPAGIGSTLLAALPLLLAAGIPLVSLLIVAGPPRFGDGPPDNYQSVFQRVDQAFVDSLLFTGLGTAALLLLSWPVGRVLARQRGSLAEGLANGCLAFPPVVIGVAVALFWSALAGGRIPTSFLIAGAAIVALISGWSRRGLGVAARQIVLAFVGLVAAGTLLGVVGMPRGVVMLGVPLVVLAYLARFLPFTARLFRNGFLALDPAEEDAARLAGHGPMSRWYHVVMPRMGGVIGAAAVVGYVLCFTELAATLMVLPPGWQSVQIRIFNMIHYRSVGEVAALCVIVILLAALPVVVLALLSRRKVEIL